MMSEEMTAVKIWETAANRLKGIVHYNAFQQWFASIVPIELKEQTLSLGVSDDFFAEWLKTNYDDIISNALKDINGTDFDYALLSGYFQEAPPAVEEKTAAVTPMPKQPTEVKSERRKNSQHTFENFVVGEENRYAFAAAKTAAESPGLYNPLYIYGGTGIGKTHLLQAVSATFYNNNPRAVVRYATCEELLNSYVESLQKNTHAEFRDSIRNVDMLLVDDVHMLANKPQLQEQFFNTFNTLYSQNKQIILTSDKQPCEIKGLEERLISRFESGVTTEISKPGFEIRLAILKMIQKENLIKLDEEVLLFIANNISSSVRRLKGALLRLVAYSSAMSTNITLDLAESILRKLIEEENVSNVITVEDIQRKVAEHFDVRITDILSSKRPKNIAEPRMVAMYLSRKLTRFSLPEIGAAFGKNHATILNAMKKVPEICEKNDSMRRSLSLLERQLTH